MRARDIVHPIGCSCEGCCPTPPTRMTQSEYYALLTLAGILLAAALCEIYALIARAPHVTVLFGGQG